jgi:hypothetical protein
MKEMLCLILLAAVLYGCLGEGKTISENVVVTTEPSPLDTELEHTFLTLNVSVTNHNPFAIKVQCFPPEGPSDTYADNLREGLPLNSTLLARPDIDCRDPNVNYSKGGRAYPTATIEPNSTYLFVLKVSRMGYVVTRSGEEIPATKPGTYDMDMRFDVSCAGLVMGCGNRHEDLLVPVKITVLPVEGDEN